MVALQGRTSDDHCNITATGTLPRAFSGGVASAARELGIQQNDFQQSTTGISTNDGLWFSRRVRQRQEEHGIPQAFGSSTCLAAVASAGRQRGQKLSNTTTFDSRHSSAGHAGASSAACCALRAVRDARSNRMAGLYCIQRARRFARRRVCASCAAQTGTWPMGAS